ncbi:hypothetical protein [Longivirga aurantiaca]|uniref:Uncharacterized protein n=1 Tax=Longivirga aurantiaca TaxID=1837743 RepID=A0ABW1T2M5_9ACTN
MAADRDATRAEELLAEADISATDSTRVVLVAVPLAILVLGVVRVLLIRPLLRRRSGAEGCRGRWGRWDG